jgi:putative ABC transport system substrate-binding protein
VKTARDGCAGAVRCAVLLLAIVLFLFGDCLASRGITVAVVESRHLKPYEAARVGFLKAMESEGFTVKFVDYQIDGVASSPADLTTFLTGAGANAVLALGTDAARAVKDANLSLPSVFSMVSEPGQSGLLNENGYGGTPMTGVCLDVPVEEQFVSLLSVVPKVQRIGVIYCPDESQFLVNQATEIANRIGLGLVTYQVYSEADVSAALSALRPKIDALWLVSDRIVLTTQSLQYVFLFAFQTNLPLMGLSDHFVKMGALFAVGPDYEDVGRQSGELAAKLLAGRSASELPVLAPRKVMLSLNLRTAEIIGLRIPESVVKKAASVY